MSDYDGSLHRHDKKKQKMESRKAASEEVRLQTTAKNRQRGCRRDVGATMKVPKVLRSVIATWRVNVSSGVVTGIACIKSNEQLGTLICT